MDKQAMSDQHQFRDTHHSHPIDRAALGTYLARFGMELDPSEPIRQFATGLANINYRLRVDGFDVVLRRPPDGELPPGAHDMKREHRVLSALAPVFMLAPNSLHLCEDTGVIGVPFQIIEYRPGLVIKGDDTSWIGDDPSRAARVGEMMVDTMIALHAVEADAAGLGDFGRPEGFVGRAIKGWSLRAQRLEPPAKILARANEISDWLRRQPVAERAVSERAPTLLHCDLKLDNMILDPQTLEVRAVVDWDMGTRGDPLFDLATLTSYWSEPGDPPCMHRMAQMPTAADGFPSRADVVGRYARETGRDVSDYPVFRVLCMFKLATVFYQLFALYGRGEYARDEYRAFDQLAAELYEFTFDVMKGSL